MNSREAEKLKITIFIIIPLSHFKIFPFLCVFFQNPFNLTFSDRFLKSGQNSLFSTQFPLKCSLLHFHLNSIETRIQVYFYYRFKGVNS